MHKPITALALVGLALLPLIGMAAGYKEIQVSNGGTVSGRVSFTGKDPAPVSYTINKDNAICGEGSREVDYVRVSDGALLDVVVYLDKVKEGKPFTAESAQAKVDQKGCRFLPFLQVMRNDTSFSSVNEDPVLHNIHAYELIRGDATGPKKTLFNISQPEPNAVNAEVKAKIGPAMKLECDAHEFMHGFVFIADNPYYAIVGEDGSYRIDNIPPGEYVIKAWHGLLKQQKSKVKVEADGSVGVNFEFQGEKNI